MLEVLLNYATLGIAAISFLALIGSVIFKRKQMSKTQIRIICIMGLMILVYFIFIGVLTFAFGIAHPPTEPVPMF